MKNRAIIPLLLVTAALLGTIQAQTEDLIKAVDQLRTLHTSGDRIAENKLAWEVIDGLTLNDIENHFFSPGGKKNLAIQKLICASEYGEISDLRPYLYQKFATLVILEKPPLNFIFNTFFFPNHKRHFPIGENQYRIGQNGELMKNGTRYYGSAYYSAGFNLCGSGYEFGKYSSYLLYAKYEKSKNPHWHFDYDPSFEQTLFCIAMQNRYTLTFQRKAFPLAKESYAYSIFCSLDEILQDNILFFGWVKLPFTRQAKILTRRYTHRVLCNIRYASIMTALITLFIPAMAIAIPVYITAETGKTVLRKTKQLFTCTDNLEKNSKTSRKNAKTPITKKLTCWAQKNPFLTAAIGTGLLAGLGWGTKKTVKALMREKTT